MKLNRSSMLYGTLVLTLTSIVSQVLGFVYRIFLSRLIGAEVMGLYQLIMPVYSVIMSLTAIGLTVAVSNLSAEYQALGNPRAVVQLLRKALTAFLVLFALVAGVTVLLYDPISVHLLGDARTQLGLLLLLPCILLTGIENLHKHYFYGTGNIRPPAAVELTEQLIRTGAVLGLLVLLLPQYPERVVGIIVAGMCCSELFSSVTLVILFRRHMGRPAALAGPGEEPRRLSRRMGAIALPIAATALLGNLMGSANAVLIPQRLVHAGMDVSAAMSAFGVLCGMTVPMLCLPTAFIGAMGLVLVPKLSQSVALGRMDEVRRRIHKALLATSVLVMPALAILVVLGPTIGVYLFREATVGRYMVPLSVGVLLSCYQSVLSGVLSGIGRQAAAARSSLLCGGGAAGVHLGAHGPARRGAGRLRGRIRPQLRPGRPAQLLGSLPPHRLKIASLPVVHRPRPVRPAHGAGHQPALPHPAGRGHGRRRRLPGLHPVRRGPLPGRPLRPGRPPLPAVPAQITFF